MGYVFGKTIHEARKNKGMTLEELAEEINSSKGYISGIETSTRRPPSDKIVARLAKILGLNRKGLIRLAHIDKIPEDIKEELRFSTVITPQKIVQETGQDLATLLRESTPGRGKKNATFLFPVGQVPVINSGEEGFPSGFEDVEDLTKNAGEFVQFNVPGIHVSFAFRMPDVSMERKKGISFEEGSLVFFAPVKRAESGDCIFTVYRSEKGLSSVFRCVKEANRRKVHLLPLNCNYRKEIILPRQNIERMWKAVGHLRLLT